MPPATDDFPLQSGTIARIKSALYQDYANAITVARAIHNDPAFCWKLFYRAHRRAPEKIQYVSRLPHLIGLLGLPYIEQLLQGSHELTPKTNNSPQLGLLFSISAFAARLSQTIAPKRADKLFFPSLFYMQPLWRALLQESNENPFSLTSDINDCLHKSGKATGPFAATLKRVHIEQAGYYSEVSKLSTLPNHLLLEYFEKHTDSRNFWLSDNGTIALCNNIAWRAIFYGPSCKQLHQQLLLAGNLWQTKSEVLFSKLSQTIVATTRDAFLNTPSQSKPNWSLAAYWLAESGCNELIQPKEKQQAALESNEILEWKSHLQKLQQGNFEKLGDILQILADGLYKAGTSRCVIMLIDHKQKQLRSIVWRGETSGDGLRKLSLSLPDEVQVSALKTLLNKPGLFILNHKNRKKIQPKLPQRLAQFLSGETLFHSLHYKNKPLALILAIDEDAIESTTKKQQQKIFQLFSSAAQSALKHF